MSTATDLPGFEVPLHRSLTEPIVLHTLEPLVYAGPAEGKPREEWTLRPAADLLKLTICDMAMGSGAFLVQACRYLSERLLEAWAAAESSEFKVLSSELAALGLQNSELRTQNSKLTTHNPHNSQLTTQNSKLTTQYLTTQNSRLPSR